MIKSPNDLFEQKVNDFLKRRKPQDIDYILSVVSMILFATEKNTDLVELFHLVDLDSFVKVISLFDGRTVAFPTKEKLVNTLVLALLYYYREVEKKSWEDIKREFPFPINSISYGIQIKHLNNFIRQRIEEIFREMDKKTEESKSDGRQDADNSQ